MASHMQGGGLYTVSLSVQDHGNADQKAPAGAGGGRHGNSTRYSSEAPSRRSRLKSYHKGKRPIRGAARGFCPGHGIGIFVFLVLCIVIITIVGGDYLFSVVRSHKGGHGSLQSHDFFENQAGSTLISFWKRRRNSTSTTKDKRAHWEDNVGHGNYYHISEKKRDLQFGKAFVQKEELIDRDSRYWDKDDRRRDRYLDYDDTGLGTANANDDNRRHDGIDFLGTEQNKDTDSSRDGKVVVNAGAAKRRDMHDVNWEFEPDLRQGAASKLSTSGSGGLYNERGRKELRIYEEQLEAALEHELDSSRKKHASGFGRSGEQRDRDGGKNKYIQASDEGIAFNANSNRPNLTEASRKENTLLEDDGDNEYDDAVIEDDESTHDLEEEDLHMSFEDSRGSSHLENLPDDSMAARGADYSVEMMATTKVLNGIHARDDISKRNQDVMGRRLSRKTRHHRHAGYPCDMNFLETTHGLHEPDLDPRFETFSLKYLEVEDPQGVAGWEPRFAGHQTLLQRNQSFIATDQALHCGFVHAAGSSRTPGFDLAEEDTQYLNTCKIAVSSCIFGSSDDIRSPRNRKLTGSFKKEVCFVMFVDQQTLDVMKQEGQQLDESGYLGSWKIVVVRNMPYVDARRVGKIPKFLTHRLFPAARYSIWLDSKLRLQSDPVLILEYFLWRDGHEYAISNHYDRHCVWEEVQQNKKLNKYNHTAIDEQFAVYQADGLTRFNASDSKRLLPSNVPEGSFIIRAHTPMSNLFSCLWFNEVDRFTSRDQLSFAYTYMKLVRTNPDKHFYLNMFKDCERKSIAKLFRHRKSGSASIQGQVHQEEVVQR